MSLNLKSDKKSWFILTSEIKPGSTAIIGGNILAFYTIHYIALVLISISLISCIAVFIQIWLNIKHRNERTKIDFSLRFPLYLAVADFLWGISHFTDHMYLIVTQIYPGGESSTALSINLWFFLGYQQLMHASLATYMYLRVVHLKTLNLGSGEWRLHTFCLSFIGITVIFFYFIGAFGCSGYWFLEDKNSGSGIVLGFTTAIVCTLNAICTTLGYRLIQKKVNEQKKNVRNSNAITTKSYHSTATQCLTTFVRNAAFLYCPFAVLAWASAIESLFGVIEPLTTFIIIIIANSSGWVNALGFFRNEKLKKMRLKLRVPGVPLLDSGMNSNTDTTPVGSTGENLLG